MPQHLNAIQFPHPGPEHKAGEHVDGVFPWNVGHHCRKFLETTGDYLTDRGRGSGALRFWGEWEAPSDVNLLEQPTPLHPRYLHRARWQDGVTGRRQNTDPLVLDGFRYSNCRQHKYKDMPSPTKMQDLDAGSVVLFGSKLHGAWVLDTVFVVASRDEYGRDEVDELVADDPLLAYAALQPLYSNPERHLRFALYRGATVEDPVDGRFSFVPALPAEAGSFARPALVHPSLNVNLTQNTRLLASGTDVHDIWETARRQVLDAGLVLATRLDGPRPPSARAGRRRTTATIGDGSRAC